MLRTWTVSARTTSNETKMYHKSVATDTKMKLMYRGVAYESNNTMDRNLIAYLMEQKKQHERKEKEKGRDLLNHVLGSK